MEPIVRVARTYYLLCTLIVCSLMIIVNNQPIPPEVITHPTIQTVVEGGNATFRCDINYDNSTNSLAAIAWERVDSTGIVYFILTGPRYYFLMDTRVLAITNISVEDAGDYYCVVYMRNPDSEERGSHSTLRVIERAAVVLPDVHIAEVVGHNVTIHAVIRGGSHITLQKRNKLTGEFEALHVGKYSVVNSTITIHYLSAEDKGEYRVCVTSLLIPNNTACTNFTMVVTGFPFISLVPLMSIRNGSSYTIVCNVTGPPTEDLQMTWQRVGGRPLRGQVTKLSKTELQLHIAAITNTVHYQCIAMNSLGRNAVITKVDVTNCVPNSPLIISLGCSNDTTYIAWRPGERNSDLPTDFIVEVNEVAQRVPPGTNSLEVYGCKDSNVLITAENSCGRSVPARATIYTTTVNRSSSSSDDQHVGNDQAIIIGLAALFVLTTGILTLVVLISWRKIYVLKSQLID